MSENAANLRNYQIQLQQVEAALLSDPDNAELVKLKDDLQVSEGANRCYWTNYHRSCVAGGDWFNQAVNGQRGRDRPQRRS